MRNNRHLFAINCKNDSKFSTVVTNISTTANLAEQITSNNLVICSLAMCAKMMILD